MRSMIPWIKFFWCSLIMIITIIIIIIMIILWRKWSVILCCVPTENNTHILFLSNQRKWWVLICYTCIISEYVNSLFIYDISPFTGLGVDHMLLLLTAWRSTNTRSTIQERTAEMFRACAISTTIMSLTDLLVFCIGSASQFRSVRYTCAASGTRDCR